MKYHHTTVRWPLEAPEGGLRRLQQKEGDGGCGVGDVYHAKDFKRCHQVLLQWHQAVVLMGRLAEDRACRADQKRQTKCCSTTHGEERPILTAVEEP